MKRFLVNGTIEDVATGERFTITKVYRNGALAKMVDENGLEKMISRPEISAGHFKIAKN